MPHVHTVDRRRLPVSAVALLALVAAAFAATLGLLLSPQPTRPLPPRATAKWVPPWVGTTGAP